MDIEKIKNKPKPRATVPISIKITEQMSNWLKKNDYSPTALFCEACIELGYKPPPYYISKREE